MTPEQQLLLDEHNQELSARLQALKLDVNYESLVNAQVVEPGLIPSAKAAIAKGFHVFPLAVKSKIPPQGSHGFEDSKAPSDPFVLEPWNQDPNRNIGIDLGASDLCVLDFDQGEDCIPSWVKETRTLKVKTAKGLHVYFKGARPTKKLIVDGKQVGDIKSAGGYVLAAKFEKLLYDTVDFVIASFREQFKSDRCPFCELMFPIADTFDGPTAAELSEHLLLMFRKGEKHLEEYEQKLRTVAEYNAVIPKDRVFRIDPLDTTEFRHYWKLYKATKAVLKMQRAERRQKKAGIS